MKRIIAFCIIIIITLFAVASPATQAHAQVGKTQLAQSPVPPLFSGLTWKELGTVYRLVSINQTSATLSGNGFEVKDPFNLEQRPDVQQYYSSTTLANAGWIEVSITRGDNGVSTLYFNGQGFYLIVDYEACAENTALVCVRVWLSAYSDISPLSAEQGTSGPLSVGTLTKSSPANGSTGISYSSVTLSWTGYTGSNFNHYRYCAGTTNTNNTCNTGWTSVWSGTSVTLSNLSSNTKYYWQVQAVLDDTTKVDADSGTYWSFTTKAVAVYPPGAYSTLFPANSSTNQSATPTLVWLSSSNATTYDYCIDSINNNICDTAWINVGSSQYISILSGVASNTTYYWQVLAANSLGTTLANSGTWASFTTGIGPANDSIKTPTVIGIPFKDTVNTTAASIDTGTINYCSPGLGYASVWYAYPATSARRIYLDTLGANYDTFIAVWTGNLDGTLSLVACNDNADGTVQSDTNFDTAAGVTYYIQVAQKNLNIAPSTPPGGTLLFKARTFLDVLSTNPFWPYIEGIYKYGLTGGCSSNTGDALYCPSSVVTRDQMAVFLLRGIHGASYTPPAVGTSTGFYDVATTYWAAPWIKELAAEGITGGCSIGYFCPTASVTRAQMAVFLLRGEHGALYTPPPNGGTTGFADVSPTYWAADWIKQLAAEGITSGCGGGNYCPEAAATRDQMAVFLSKTFGIAVAP